MASRPIEVEVDGTVHRVVVERAPSADQPLRVSWGETVHLVDARRLDAETLSLVGVGGDPVSLEARVVRTKVRGQLNITIDGVSVSATVDAARTFLGGDTRDPSHGLYEILAPMPGKVVRILVQAGDDVVAKQGVVVVEAMKMENELSTPRAGTVKRIPVREGVTVDAGTVLAVIE